MCSRLFAFAYFAKDHTLASVVLDVGRLVDLFDRKSVCGRPVSNFLENLFFGEKNYPSKAKRSFFLPREKKYSVRPAENTGVNLSHAGTNLRIHKYLVLVKPSDTK